MHAEVKAPERGLFRSLVDACALAEAARQS
jgi:hypothetical protein